MWFTCTRDCIEVILKDMIREYDLHETLTILIVTWLNEWIEKCKDDLIIKNDRVISRRYDVLTFDEYRFMIITGLLD